MYAEEILQLDLRETSVRRRLEMYGYGIRTAKVRSIDFKKLETVCDDMGGDPEEIKRLWYEFMKGYLHGLP